jgi:hypothetical protein
VAQFAADRRLVSNGARPSAQFRRSGSRAALAEEIELASDNDVASLSYGLVQETIVQWDSSADSLWPLQVELGVRLHRDHADVRGKSDPPGSGDLAKPA